MLLRLVIALSALAVLHFLPRLRDHLGTAWLKRWARLTADTSGAGRIALLLAVPLAVCLLVAVLLGAAPGGTLWFALWALAVLLWSFGTRDLDADLGAVLAAAGTPQRESALQALGEDGETLRWQASALAAPVALAALRRRFGVLAWFFLLGPLGALAYRLIQTLARDRSLALDAGSRRGLRFLRNGADWLPAQLLTFTLAIVGDWDAVLAAWRDWQRRTVIRSWYAEPPGFLAAAAGSGTLFNIDAGDGYAEESSDPVAELERLQRLLQRALVAWLGVLLLIAFGGWIG